MLTLLAAILAVPQAEPARADVPKMAALYDEICLRTFPIDEHVDALMARKGATALTPDQVKVTLRDDPGRAWWIKDGERTYSVFLELPPFHACSVRGNVGSGTRDLTGYRAAVDAFKASHRGFATQPPMDADQGDIHIHAETEFRELPDGTGEQLMMIDQSITNAERRAKGETGTVLRFVHQIRVAK